MEEKSDIVRWINAQLKSHDYKTVTHLEAELADGITLLRLVQIVADEQLPRHFLRPVMRVQKIENLKLCLQFLQGRGIELCEVKAEDVADGDIHSILLLMRHLRQWHSTSTGQEEENSSLTAHENPAIDSIQSHSGGRNIINFSVMTKDDIAILNWVTEMIHMDLSSYSQMSNGRALCNLVNRLSPGAVDIRTMLTASPVERVQIALAGAERHLDVRPGTTVAQSFIEGRDPDKLRHYLEQLQIAHRHQLKKREEHQHQRRLESQLEQEQNRHKTKERRILQQQKRASERRRINIFDSQIARSKESLNPVENLAHQAQKKKEQQERTDCARNDQGQGKLHTSYKARLEEEHREVAKQVESAEMHDGERGERANHERNQHLEEEQEKCDQLQKQRMDEERKKRLIEELKKREQVRQRRQSQQQTYLERHKQQVTDSHKDNSNSLSPSDIVRRAAASASGQLAETDGLLSGALSGQHISASEGQKSAHRAISLIHSKRLRKGPRRRAVSMTDFRACALDTIEEERKSSGSSTPSEEKPLDLLDTLQRTLSEGDVRREGAADDYSIVPINPVIMRAVQKDVGFHIQQTKPLMPPTSPLMISSLSDQRRESLQTKSGSLVVQSEQDDVRGASSISPSGQRDSMPDVVEHSEERQEMSSGWNEKLERRLLELEENNIKLEALLEQERNRRVRHWAKRTQTQARKREIKACLDHFSRVSQLASQRIQDYDACMVTFSRRLSHLQSEVARLFEQFVSKESEEIRFVRDELMVELDDKVKALAEKLKSSERRRVTPASSPHQLEMDDASVRGGPLARKKKPIGEGKGNSIEPKTSRPLFNFGKGKKSYHQSYQQIDSSETVEPSKSPSLVYSQSQVQLRQTDKPQRSGVQIQRRESLYKLANFFGQRPPHDLHMFLDGLGYSCYANVFDREHVTMVELQHMNEEHLAQMGIPLGPRVVMMKALKGLKLSTAN